MHPGEARRDDSRVAYTRKKESKVIIEAGREGKKRDGKGKRKRKNLHFGEYWHCFEQRPLVALPKIGFVLRYWSRESWRKTLGQGTRAGRGGGNKGREEEEGEE